MVPGSQRHIPTQKFLKHPPWIGAYLWVAPPHKHWCCVYWASWGLIICWNKLLLVLFLCLAWFSGLTFININHCVFKHVTWCASVIHWTQEILLKVEQYFSTHPSDNESFSHWKNEWFSFIFAFLFSNCSWITTKGKDKTIKPKMKHLNFINSGEKN